MIVLMGIHLGEQVAVCVVGNDCMCVCVNIKQVQMHSGDLVCSGFKLKLKLIANDSKLFQNEHLNLNPEIMHNVHTCTHTQKG